MRWLIFPEPFTGLEKTRLYRNYRDVRHPGAHHGVVYRWPCQREIADGAVFHDCLPPATTRQAVIAAGVWKTAMSL